VGATAAVRTHVEHTLTNCWGSSMAVADSIAARQRAFHRRSLGCRSDDRDRRRSRVGVELIRGEFAGRPHATRVPRADDMPA
jgi:hypothetical protein